MPTTATAIATAIELTFCTVKPACESCRFYLTTAERSWIGECTIQLPKFVKTSIAANAIAITRADDYCDLHQPATPTNVVNPGA